MKLLSIARQALKLGRTERSDRKYFLKKVLACKKAELSGDYREAYYKLLDVFENHLDSFGFIMRGNTAAADGAGPHFHMVFNIPIECLGLDKKIVFAVAAMYNLYKTNFPSVPENFRERKGYWWHGRVPGDTSYFCLYLNDNNRYLGEMRPIDNQEYDSIDSREKHVDFTDGYGYYNTVEISYKVREVAWGYPVIYLECQGHYYKYCWQLKH